MNDAPQETAESRLPAADWNQMANWIFALFVAAIAGAIASATGADAYEATLLVATGAGAGWLTNVVAVNLLFNPVKPMFGGLLYGVFYRGRDAFGTKLIETASERILTPDFFRQLLLSDQVSAALNGIVRDGIGPMLSNSPGTPRQLVTRLTSPGELDSLLDRIAIQLGHLTSTGCTYWLKRGGANQLMQTVASHLEGSDCGDVLSKEHLIRVLALLQGRLDKSKLEDGLESVERFLRVQARQSDRTIGSFFSSQQQRFIENLVGEIAAQRLRGTAIRMLRNPRLRNDTRALVRSELHELLAAQVRRSSGLRRLFLNLITSSNQDEIRREADKAVNDGMDRMARKLEQDDPHLGTLFEDAFKQITDEFWSLRLADVLEALPAESTLFIRQSLAGVITGNGGRKIVSRLVDLIHPLITHINVGQAFGDLASAPQLSNRLQELLAQPDTVRILRVEYRSMILRLLDHQLPTAHEWVPGLGLSAKGIEGLVVNHVNSSLRTAIPKLIASLPIREQLRSQWDYLSNEDIRDAVQDVLGNEFRTLINFGISLGAMAGIGGFLIKSFLTANTF